jgi:8-oxo-dGTP pyrophosphatase MutT (NUDIX family)
VLLDHVLNYPEIARLATTLQAAPGTTLDIPEGEGPLHAAVALVLRPGPTGELEMLLIKRAEFEGDPWSGHVALPGGRREPGDATLEQTAVRETWEETGVDVARDGAVLGTLDEISPRMPTVRRVVVRPYVCVVVPDVAIVESPEVAAAFWVPLPALRETAAWIEADVMAHGQPLRVPAFAHGEYVVWGLTERILRAFLHIAGDPTA